MQHESVRLTLRDAAEHDALWETTRDVLRRLHFRIDRDNKTLGVITTFPEVSGHWFELWRRDTATPYDFAEANLHTVRREVMINVVPTNEETVWRLAARVDKTRQSSPERQVSDPAAGLRIFSASIPTASGHLMSRQEAIEWIDLGRDPAMEYAILDRIMMLFAPESYAFIPEPAEPSPLPTAANEPTDSGR